MTFELVNDITISYSDISDICIIIMFVAANML